MCGGIGLSRHLKKLSLSTVITMGLAILIVPIMVFVLVFGYQQHSAATYRLLEDRIARSQKNVIKSTESLIRPAQVAIEIVSEVAAAKPSFFKTEASRELLYQCLLSAKSIDAIYVSFEDGYHRVLTRIDADRRRADPQIPQKAQWHSSYFDEFAAGPKRRRHRTFFDTWPNVVGQYEEETTIDIRKLAHYEMAKKTSDFAIAEPSINPDTGHSVLSLAAPVMVGGIPGKQAGKFIGIVGADITMDVLSKFLKVNHVSENSVTLIADQNGKIIAHPVEEKGVRKAGNELEFVNLADSDDSRIREAVRQPRDPEHNNFRFTTSEGVELSVSFLDFPKEFGRPWHVIVITPTDDFVGELKTTSRTIGVVIGLLLVVEMLLIYLLSRGLSRGLETVSRQFQAIQELKFIDTELRPSPIREVADLQSGFALLRNALKTFAQYVPLDVVRQLVESGQPLGLGVEPRPLTIFFSDLENFSTIAEKMAPDDLLRQVSEYFSAVTEAIAQEQGTVDKFIGDAVMAFWGAPLPREDHVLRACAGALRAVRRMEKLNQQWTRQGRPTLRLRIGLHTATVLVGNVGSSERLSYTVMGDGVNVASRLEGKNKDFGSTICISDRVFEAVGDRLVARPLGRVVVKGRQSEFQIYELLGLKESDDPELQPRAGDLERAEFAWQASTALAAGDRSTARLIHLEAVRRFPHDAVAHALLAGLTPGPGNAAHET
jgi:adenylate cyclase